MTLNPRTLLLPVLLAAALVGCNRGPDRAETLPPVAVPAGATVRYPPRTDLMPIKLDAPTLARGAVVYRRWCMQCHGPAGAGGPAQAVEGGPPPRDFRQGAFKYVTAFPPPGLPKKNGLGSTGKPRRDDLRRTVRRG